MSSSAASSTAAAAIPAKDLDLHHFNTEEQGQNLPKYSLATCIRRPSERKSQVYSIEFFPSDQSQVFACCGGRRVTIFQINTSSNSPNSSESVEVVRGFSDEDEKEDFYCCIWTVSQETNKPMLCVGGESGVIKILDIDSCALSLYLTGHGGPVYDFALHPTDADLLVSCSKDESVRLWSINARRCVAVFAGDQGHRDAVLSVDIHHTGMWLASSGMDNTIKIWELDSDAVTQAIAAGKNIHVPSSSSSNLSESKARKFRAPFIQFPAFSTRRVHTDYVDCVKWVGDLLLSKSIESKCLLWKPDTRRRANSVALLRQYPYSSGTLWYVRFGLSSDSRMMVVGADDGSLFLFNVDRGGDAEQHLKHGSMKSLVRSARFSADDQYIVSCCDDGTIWCFRREE